MLDLARRWLAQTLQGLRIYIQNGTALIGLEPSCLAVFRDELVNLFPRDADARRLHDQSFVLSEFLLKKVPDYQAPQLDRQAVVQPHCHHYSVIGFDDEISLLRQAGLELDLPDAGCCGMAGSFGYEAGERYEVSMAAGERKLLPAVRAAGERTLIVADGFSCRSQIAAATDRRALHLAQVLQLAVRHGRSGPLRGRPEAAASPMS
jgi:Fe-S oxidoreductase